MAPCSSCTRHFSPRSRTRRDPAWQLTPEENPVRLHCANGVTAGHDGWLYLAMGDHGCIVNRPEGDKLVLEGGGILRCRPDGRDLHIFSTGLRNIYDVALDAELNVFVRDNENDGGDYKIRVCHSFFGANHGYPYDYYERPSYALAPIADLGLGSSAGGVYYLETQFPLGYRENLFFCEWGKSLVCYALRHEGAGFAKPVEIEFAASAENDPYGFKPTDVVVQRDGTIMISDYADGQRPKRGRGRIYHIRWNGTLEPPKPFTADTPLAELVAKLDSPRHSRRWEAQLALERKGEAGAVAVTEALRAAALDLHGRLHAIWILAHWYQEVAIEPLLKLAADDRDDRVRAQAVRAIGDLADPVLSEHRLCAGAGDATLAKRLSQLRSPGGVPRSTATDLELAIVLGRLKWQGLPDFSPQLDSADPAVAHAKVKALRRAGNWPATLAMTTRAKTDLGVMQALQAMSDVHDPVIVDGLIFQLEHEKDAKRRLLFADALARVYKKPAPWVYWDYRPKPRPANTVAWERTEAIGAALDKVLLDSDASTRMSLLQRMQRERIPAGLAALGSWLESERDEANVALLLTALRDHPSREVRPHLAKIIREPKQSEANRLAAVEMYIQGPEGPSADEVLELVKSLPDSSILAALLRHSARVAKAAAIPLLQSKLASAEPSVQAAAIEGLGELKAPEARTALLPLLENGSPLVRRAAALAAGKLEEKQTTELLLKLAADPDALVRAASLESLRMLREKGAVPLAVAALDDRVTELPALQLLSELGSMDQATAVAGAAKRNLSAAVLSRSVQTLTFWRGKSNLSAEEIRSLDQHVAEIQGASGSLLRWKAGDQFLLAFSDEGRVFLEGSSSAETSVFVSEPTGVEFLATSSGPLEIQLEGKTIYKREKPQEYRLDSDRFSASLAKGENRLTVLLGLAAEMKGQFQLRFRRKSATQAHEKLIAAALARSGNPEQGKLVFQNLEKSLCLKCHRVQDQGEKTGPELTGLGNRFSRIYIAESILDPSRAIAPSFGTLVLRLDSGQVVSGIKIAETETSLTLVDNQAQKHVVAKADIEEQKTSPSSTMPEGLEKKLSEGEFVDLVAYLASLKESKP
jgi:putative heme-binding domain-containing protein